MKQEFYDAKTGKQNKKPDNSGSLKKRIEALEAKIREITGIQTPAPTPTPSVDPMSKKKALDRSMNPDTGDIAAPNDPTVKYDGSCGSGPSYHFNGRKI